MHIDITTNNSNFIKHTHFSPKKVERFIPSCPQFQTERAEYSETEETPSSLLGKALDTNICSMFQSHKSKLFLAKDTNTSPHVCFSSKFKKNFIFFKDINNNNLCLTKKKLRLCILYFFSQTFSKWPKNLEILFSFTSKFPINKTNSKKFYKHRNSVLFPIKISYQPIRHQKIEIFKQNYYYYCLKRKSEAKKKIKEREKEIIYKNFLMKQTNPSKTTLKTQHWIHKYKDIEKKKKPTWWIEDWVYQGKENCQVEESPIWKCRPPPLRNSTEAPIPRRSLPLPLSVPSRFLPLTNRKNERNREPKNKNWWVSKI